VVSLTHKNGYYGRRMEKLLKRIVLVVLSVAVGALGGLLFGFVIISFGDYIGRSGNTGQPPGVWYADYAWFVAKTYGTPIGAMLFPIGYFGYLRRANLLWALGITTLGTLGGGLVGALAAPPAAAIAGCVGFFISCGYVARSS
jgi:hypothetical protein